MRYFRWVNKVVDAASRLLIAILAWLAFLVARFRARKAVLSSRPGLDAPGRIGPRVVLFCHFDRLGQIREHTRAYIDALCAEGLDLVFVTNAGFLTPSDDAWIATRAAHIIIRRNLGHDFGAWRDALHVCGLPSPNTQLLLIANDSVYGPLRPLGPILDRIDFQEADVWSVTDSWQHRFHLQSFFVAFAPPAFRHASFSRFWKAVLDIRSKRWVVMHYEIGLSRTLIAAGLRCRALFPYTEMIDALRSTLAAEGTRRPGSNDVPDLSSALELILSALHAGKPADPFIKAKRQNVDRILATAAGRIPLNATSDLWQVLLEQGCPFLKRELLRANPTKVPGVAEWADTVRRIDGTGHELIMHDLARSLKNRSP